MVEQQHIAGEYTDATGFNTKKQASQEMALVIDLQEVEYMQPQDAQNYLNALGDTLTKLRQSNVPVTWVTIGPNSALYEPEAQNSPVQNREMNELVDMGFFGVQEAHQNHEIFRQFMQEHGPRTNEAVFQKAFKSALIESADIEGKEDYKKSLEEQSGVSFEDSLPEDKSLVDYLSENNTKNLTLMGAVSNHCVTETAVSATTKGYSATILSDRVLSWVDEERYVDTRPEAQKWSDNSQNPLSWHATKISDAIESVSSDPERAFSASDLNAISAINITQSENIFVENLSMNADAVVQESALKK